MLSIIEDEVQPGLHEHPHDLTGREVLLIPAAAGVEERYSELRRLPVSIVVSAEG